MVSTWRHQNSKIQNRKTPEFLPFTGYWTSLRYILLKVLSSIASAVFKTEHFEFRSFTPHDIKMAARRLSCMLKNMPQPVIFNNINSWGFRCYSPWDWGIWALSLPRNEVFEVWKLDTGQKNPRYGARYCPLPPRKRPGNFREQCHEKNGLPAFSASVTVFAVLEWSFKGIQNHHQTAAYRRLLNRLSQEM